ncbi:MAG: M1 family peptidase [Flavobacteriales bacterium]|nr:M1 family peptidase [Flavobacteriales bacterium]
MRIPVQKHTWIIAVLGISMGFSACKTQEKAAVSEPEEVVVEEVAEEPVEIETREYRAANTMAFDLIHTTLDVRFDWAKQQLSGKAEIILKPYFYATDKLTLDAKGFDLRSVSLKKGGNLSALKYTYDKEKIYITLDREYTNKDTLTVWVDYIAKPEELEAQGSAAITDAKGLYFINPKGEDKNKPKQIWTQGETESSSCWFPTIDSPNQNMTQDIKMTVDSRYVTLSNGLLVSSKQNGDGTRTDHWKQTLPHAPYLVMMAVGEFAVVKDKWNGIDVDYFVEPAYEPYAKAIFGETPNMLQFYSDVLDYPYAWEKYDQIVVRDYVSGAMENTSATLHGEFLNKTDREMIDGDNEEIIAHELFHHWFGDLVTCESWSNLPLNESFATYGEYMWLEHRHGRAEADKHGYEQLRQYIASLAQTGPKDMIRFYYDDKEDMFDAHSYAKGGRILHMLRKTLGDEAFYKGLNVYLTENKFHSVEMHQLRLAMEKVTGMDLNWFFNQWFFDKGHPSLTITHDYNAEAKKYYVTIEQTQDLKEFPLYRIPMDVDVYFGGAVDRHRIDLTEQKQTFEFDVLGEPQLVNVDAEKMLLGTKDETLTEDQYIYMLKEAPLYLDKAEALAGLKFSKNPDAVEAILGTLDDEFWGTRRSALKALKNLSVADTSALKNKLIWLAQKDTKSLVRADAIAFLAEKFAADPNVQAVIEGCMKDQSYAVLGATLNAISDFDSDKAMSIAKAAVADASGSMISSIASLYAQNGSPEQLDFFLNGYKKLSDPNGKYVFIQIFGKYLMKQDVATQTKGMDLLTDMALNAGEWWMRISAIQVLAGIQKVSESQESDDAKALVSRIKGVLDEVRAKETNEMIRGMLGE